MRNFIYAFRQVFRLKGANLIKVLSLTLGIAISGALMCRVAWEQSYDNFWSDVDNLHYVEISFQNKEAKESGTTDFQKQTLSPMAPEIKAKIPAITAITRFGGPSSATFRVGSGDRLVDLSVWGVDSLFFDVFDLDILEGGDPHQILATPYDLLISRATADKLFEGANAIGKELRIKEQVFTVAGVFEELPRNSYLRQMGALEVVHRGFFRTDWDGGDSYYTYFRTKPNTDIAALEAQIADILNPHMESWKENGLNILYRTQNIRYAFYEQTKSIDLIMSLLAFALILIAGFNFALLSITSLASRAKEVGVHKASGASAKGIFALIIWEAIIYSVLALGLATIFMYSFESQLEDIMGRFDDVFAIANLWALGVMLLVVIAVAGVIPATIFARIPVTQVFQRFTATKAHWKQVLLFIQFTSSIFVICFTFIIIKQYNAVSTKDLGYKYDNLVTVQLMGAKGNVRQTLADNLKLRSNVVDLCYSSALPLNGMSGIMVSTESSSDDRFSSRFFEVDSNFFSVYNIPIDGVAELSTFRSQGVLNIVGNKELVRMLDIRGAKNRMECFIGDPMIIRGVTSDFQVGNGLYNNRQPLLIFALDTASYYAQLTIRLNRVDRAAIDELQPIVDELYPDLKPEIKIYSSQIENQYCDNRMFRDGVILASAFLMIITIMGIMGYIGTETRRRSKEIAVRKIFGSSAAAVVLMLARNITIIALIGSAFGIPMAYIMGGYWQQEFAVKVDLTADLFIYATAIVLLTIVVCVTLQTWRIANADPAKSIKSE